MKKYSVGKKLHFKEKLLIGGSCKKVRDSFFANCFAVAKSQNKTMQCMSIVWLGVIHKPCGHGRGRGLARCQYYCISFIL